MKRLFFIILISFLSATAFAQNDGMVTEEKASAWVKVTTVSTVANPARTTTNTASSATTSRPATRSATPKPATSQPANAQPKSSETFNKANQKVKRFKKS